ncbi:MAG TPA: hypothetical protein VE132_02915, partial [Micromonosporaceae bacterium]|nr:hypothetical protein [Micromonosporaceae bacterium]
MQSHENQDVEVRDAPTAPSAMTRPLERSTQLEKRSDVYPVSWRYWPIVAMVVAAGVLIGVGFWSQTVPPLPFGAFSHRPIYGVFKPTVSPLALTLVPAGLLFAGTAWVVTSSRRLPTWLALGLTVVTALFTAVAVALVRGNWHQLIQGVSTKRGTYYTTDLHFVARYGIRGFVRNYPILEPKLHSYNGKTHPPGVQIFLWVIYKISGHGYPLLM